MADREKVIKALAMCEGFPHLCGLRKECPYSDNGEECEENMHNDAIELLKEQEDLGTELTNAVELIRKKNERIEKLLKKQEAQKFFVDESGKITPLPVVVRCKDCKHRGNSKKCVLSAISEEKDFPLFMLDNRGDWFCADGERRADT